MREGMITVNCSYFSVSNRGVSRAGTSMAGGWAGAWPEDLAH